MPRLNPSGKAPVPTDGPGSPWSASRQAFYEDLAEIGLSDRQIQDYPSRSLGSLIEIADEALARYRDFGKKDVNVRLSGTERITLRVDIRPALLSAKEQVSERIAQGRREDTARKLKEKADLIPDGPEREAFLRELSKAKEYEEEVDREGKEIALEKIRAELWMTKESHLEDLRSQRWARRAEKESVATIIGAAILMAFTVCLIVAMFKHFDPPELLSNSFLIILGYFFGQSAERRSTGSQEKERED